MVIAIDGPAGAGKSSVARAVAQRLGFTYLDTGAMYRAVALADGRAVEDLDIRVGERVLLDGRDVTDAIRTPEISARASEVSADPVVRAALVRKQQLLLAEGDWVAEGRDIGTVVAPHAGVKVFLTAAPEERARRRAHELHADESTVLHEQREHSPLRAAPDAIELDSTDRTLEDVVSQIAALVRERRAS